MNRFVIYTYVLLFVIIRFINCSDQGNYQQTVIGNGDDSDDEDNFDVIASGIENILEDETAGDSVVSRSVIEHGLGHIVYDSYGSESITKTQTSPDEFSESESEDEESGEGDENFEVKEIFEKAEEQFNEEEGYDECILEQIRGDNGGLLPELPSTTIIGLNDKGKLFKLKRSDCYLIKKSRNLVKFEFSTPIVEIFHNGMTVWKHKDIKEKPTWMSYNIKDKVYIIDCGPKLESFRFIKDRWIRKGRQIPQNIKLIKITILGKELEMTDNDYDIELSSSGNIKYMIKRNIKCVKIIRKELVVWEKDPQDSLLRMVSIGETKYIVLYFDDYLYILKKKQGIYVKDAKLQKK